MWKNYKVSELTEDTTDEFLMEPVETARQNLITVVTNGEMSHRLADYVNAVADAEGQMMAASEFVSYLQNGATRSRAIVAVNSRALASGADDRWSGRTNDARRAFFDGKREMIAELFDDIIRFA